MKRLYPALIIFTISRLFLLAMLLYFRYVILQGDVSTDEQVPISNGILDLFIYYDSYNYHDIALQGYFNDKMTAFFPLFPLLTSCVHRLTGVDVYWIGFGMSNLFYLLALFMLDLLLTLRKVPRKTVWITMSLLSFFPATYFFSAFYTESLFLFLSLSAFLFWEKEKRGLAYVLAGFLCLTRLVGFFLPLAFFLDRLTRKKLDRKDFVFCLLSSLIGSLYPLYLYFHTGDALRFSHVLYSIFHRESVLFPFPLIQEIIWFIQKIYFNYYPDPIVIFHFCLIALAIAYFKSQLQGFKNTNVAEIIYSAGLVILPLSTILHIHAHIATHGFMRYFIPIFPIFIFMSNYLLELITTRKKVIFLLVSLIWILFYCLSNAALSVKSFLA